MNTYRIILGWYDKDKGISSTVDAIDAIQALKKVLSHYPRHIDFNKITIQKIESGCG